MNKSLEFSATSDELLEILKMDEDINLEFKENFGDNTLKTISAFSNTDGGKVIIGVNKDKIITGIQLKDNDYQNIVNRIVSKLSITPEFKVVNIAGKKVLIINVRKSSIPVSFDGRYYKRVGNTTREMTFEELKSYFRKDLRWERIKEKGKITNREYREMFNITDRTALNDLKSLCDKGLLKKIGKTGRATEYILAEINPKNTK